MKAIVQHGYGAPEEVLRLGDLPDPTPGPGEVLVAMRATSVNTPDWITTTATPAVIVRPQAGWRTPRKPVRGTDIAGVVVAVGDGVDDLPPGTEVMGSTWAGSLRRGYGTFAELTVARADRLIPKPGWLPFGEAAASVMSGNTARTALCEVADIGPGTTVLVNGASGGVGTFAVQIAAALGAFVTGVCSGRNAALVTGLGAQDVIDRTTTDFTTVGRRFDVVLDNVLNHPLRRIGRVVADGGLLIPNSVGPTDGPLGGLLAGLPRMLGGMALGATPLKHLVGLGHLRVATATEQPSREALAAVVDLLASKDVRPVVAATYPLEKAPAAVAHMLSHRARGNVVIEV